MIKIVTQLLREFWLPFAAAIGWTLYNLQPFSEPDGETAITLKAIVNIFGPTFFLASWMTGVLRQLKQDINRFQDMESGGCPMKIKKRSRRIVLIVIFGNLHLLACDRPVPAPVPPAIKGCGDPPAGPTQVDAPTLTALFDAMLSNCEVSLDKYGCN